MLISNNGASKNNSETMKITNYLRIKNHGQICKFVGENSEGGVILKNTNGGRDFVFHRSAVESCAVSQYTPCWFCQCPVEINKAAGVYFTHTCCSDECRSEMREHYN